jgi:hypothetical protein
MRKPWYLFEYEDAVYRIAWEMAERGEDGGLLLEALKRLGDASFNEAQNERSMRQKQEWQTTQWAVGKIEAEERRLQAEMEAIRQKDRAEKRKWERERIQMKRDLELALQDAGKGRKRKRMLQEIWDIVISANMNPTEKETALLALDTRLMTLGVELEPRPHSEQDEY